MRFHLGDRQPVHQLVEEGDPALLLRHGCGIVAPLVRSIGGEKAVGVIAARGDDLPEAVAALGIVFVRIHIARLAVDHRLAVDPVALDIARKIGGLLHHHIHPRRGAELGAAGAAGRMKRDGMVVGIVLFDHLSPIGELAGGTVVIIGHFIVLAAEHPDHIFGREAGDEIADIFLPLIRTEIDILLGPGEENDRHDPLAEGIVDTLVDPVKIAGIELIVILGISILDEAGAALILPETKTVDVADHDRLHGGVALRGAQIDDLFPAAVIGEQGGETAPVGVALPEPGCAVVVHEGVGPHRIGADKTAGGAGGAGESAAAVENGIRTGDLVAPLAGFGGGHAHLPDILAVPKTLDLDGFGRALEDPLERGITVGAAAPGTRSLDGHLEGFVAAD